MRPVSSSPLISQSPRFNFVLSDIANTPQFQLSWLWPLWCYRSPQDVSTGRGLCQSQANAIMINDILIIDQDQAATAWAHYYKDLATPKERNICDADFLCSTEQQLQVVHQYAASYQSQSSVSYHKVTRVVKILNSGKAADLDGIPAPQGRPHHHHPRPGSLFSDLIRLGAPPSMKTG